MQFWVGWCRFLARGYPWPVDVSDELDRATTFLESDLAPETVTRAGYTAAGLGAVVAAAAASVLGVTPATVPLVALAAGLVLAHVVHSTPCWLASLRQSAALGDAPDLVGRAVLRMHVEPTAESAAAFAAESDDGPLAASLGQHVRGAAGTPESGLGSFVAAWRDTFPALRRALNLVVAAADAPAGERSRTLDRAMTAVLRGTRDRLASFTATVQGPVTGIYAFGVLLPLALVAVLPAARVAGLPVTIGALVVTYDGLLPAMLLVASAWLFTRRPVAFPPPAVSRAHPDVPSRPWRALAAGALSLGLAVLGVPLLAPGWLTPLVAPALGVGVALSVWYRPVAAVRDHAKAVESNLVDALYLVGRRVAEGEAVEAALDHAAGEVSGETGDVLAAACRRQRQLRVGVREAFLGEHGALARVPSPRARSTAALLALAAAEGAPAGRAIVSMADHLDDLQALERECQHDLARVTGTLRSTATTFGPLVAGATVAMADGMGLGGGAVGALGGPGGGSMTAPPLATPDLGLAVGAYVLLLSVVLTVLATGLQHGLDRTLVGVRVGRALPTAALVYAGAFLAAGAMV
ncbi:type II secretion system protein [Haloarchaeobius amylolyticus]|uniref:type II secretion system protein n=1 Tax=Haloarchaeobius amylolyticus TaxID=1198296 RepID=UPI00226EA446|nr:type II secretion system protein [Haloarchaeobius amylolyticus]